MSGDQFLITLKNRFDPDTWPWLLSALRQDDLIWESLETGGLGLRILAEHPFGESQADPWLWSPGALALFDLAQPMLFKALSSAWMSIESTSKGIDRPTLPSLPHALRSLARRMLAEWANAPARSRQPVRLAEAGLLALGLREKRLEQPWAQVWGDLPEAAIHFLPPASLACLFGLVPDPLEMLASFLRLAVPTSTEDLPAGPGLRSVLAATCLLAQPLHPSRQAVLAVELVSCLYSQAGEKAERSGDFAAHFLLALQQRSPSIAALVAERLPEGWTSSAASAASPNAELEALALLERQALLHGLRGEEGSAYTLLETALAAARRLQASLAIRQAALAGKQGDHTAALHAWRDALRSVPDSSLAAGSLALSLLDAGHDEEAQAWLSAHPSALPQAHPTGRMAEALLSMKNGQPEPARTLALELVSQHEAMEALSTTDRLSPGQQVRLARLLLDLNEPLAAGKILKLALRQSPQDYLGLEYLAEACLAQDQPAPALGPALMACTSKSVRSAARRILIASLEKLELWPAALTERLAQLERTQPLAATLAVDLKNAAACALKAGQPQTTLRLAQQSAALEPNDGTAQALIGQAQSALGNDQAALEHYRQATRLSPDAATNWLALAHTYQALGQPAQMLDTLRSAVLALPSDAGVQLSLGKALLQQDAAIASPTTALTHLRRAWELAPAGSALAYEIGLPLGATLLNLGHLADARHVLQTAYASAPTTPDPELAYALSRALLALKEPAAALPVLECVIDAGSAPASVYLDLARAALELSWPAGGWECVSAEADLENPGLASDWKTDSCSGHENLSQRALPALQQALALDPTLHEARALLAEAQAANGDLISAAESFRRALETPLAGEPAWRARLASGLGRVSLALGRFETAVAALDEAHQAAPENSQIRRYMAEAMLAAGLDDDALAAARAALEADPNRLETLVWFAGLAMRVPLRSSESISRARQEALTALQRAVELAPERGDLWLRLAIALENATDIPAARACLVRLAASIQSGQSPAELCLTPADLLAAGQALRRLKEPASAAALLEQLNPPAGVEAEGEASQPGMPDPAAVWSEIAAARQESGNRTGALQALEHGLAHDPQSISLHMAHAGLLAELNHPGEALTGLELALEALLKRTDVEETTRRTQRLAIHLQLARLFRKLDRLAPALKHAEAAAALEGRAVENSWEAHALAASLAHSLLLDDQARKWLSPLLEFDTLAGSKEKTRTRGPASTSAYAGLAASSVTGSLFARQYHAACLAAEITLAAGGSAKEYIDLAQRIQSDGPRGQAARLRWECQNEDWDTAQHLLAGLLTHPNDNEPASVDDPAQPALSTAQAALDLGEWQIAGELLDRAVQAAPYDPLIRLLQVRRLVETAEARTLALKLDRVRFAPPAASLSEEAAAAFDEQMQALLRLAASSTDAASGTGGAPAGESPLLREASRWQRRGQSVFHPTPQNIRALASSAFNNGPEDIAVLVMALGQNGQYEAAAEAAGAFPNHPAALLQLALALEETQPRQALSAAYRLVEQLQSQPSGDLLFIGDAHYLLARLAHSAGSRSSDELAARNSIRAATEAVPHEPRWRALAAQIFLSNDEPSPEELDQAIFSLEEAVNLEPENPAHALALGRAHLLRTDSLNAVSVLRAAAEQWSENGEIWLALARAETLAQVEEAAASAERAIELLTDPTPALLLRGELALKEGSPRSAYSRAQAALRIHPDHTHALQILAHALHGMDRPAEALSILERAIPLSENPLPLRLERIRLVRQAQGAPAALAALVELSEEQPGDARVLSALASALWDSGKAEQAVTVARQALMAGSSTLPLDEQGGLHAALGRALRRAGQLDSAVHHLSEAVRCVPHNLDNYLELGQAHAERRQHSQALNVFRQAIGVAQHDPRPYYQAGLALKESKDYLGAENMLRRAAALAPTDLSIHRQLGAVVALNLVHNRIGG